MNLKELRKMQYSRLQTKINERKEVCILQLGGICPNAGCELLEMLHNFRVEVWQNQGVLMIWIRNTSQLQK